MRFAAATTLLFATLALANPAPIARPEADGSQLIETRSQLHNALAARDAEALHNIQLEARAKKPKPGSGSSGNDTGAADMISPSRALQLGALGLGVIEVVRLWG
ncbi:hypothetical protein IQ07DRAFT_598631 [Pyrenochaeta sp. DS3sAY3a]|nr:hypothetical protein IQ07DRAFT_598631 [Pyrenochaeta sp. DS3sAY3a]